MKLCTVLSIQKEKKEELTGVCRKGRLGIYALFFVAAYEKEAEDFLRNKSLLVRER